jgi:hypothetical protein
MFVWLVEQQAMAVCHMAPMGLRVQVEVELTLKLVGCQQL